MRLTDPNLLRQYMDRNDYTQARLARHAECSRQFIWQLLNDPTKRSCTEPVGHRIEEALGLIRGTLFVPNVSLEQRQSDKPQKTGRAA